MSETSLAIIRRVFVETYEDLRARLTSHLGSPDRAGDALHDAWIRLARMETVGVVQSPRSYLFRIALNAADDQRRLEKRYLSAVEIGALLDLPDMAPTPEDIVIGRSDHAAFEVILAELPARRRAIFLAARIGNIPRQDIADRLGISRRLVAKELLRAHQHFVARYREMRD